MKLIAIINPENVSDEEVKKFKTRVAARGIVYDNDGKVAILNVSKKNYHKLPGGGVEEGEDLYETLKRECREEIGCEVEISGEVGEIIEYRKLYEIKQTSFCYTAKVVGEKGKPQFTEDEAEKGFEILWLPIQEARALLAADFPSAAEGKMYIVPRDKAFLEQIK